ncbi:MAG TPA: DUF364 domain-containing protein [Methanotrichaceae archaeon]|nr:DUF364 domain-containing protein [Methanotrichaceae archaeon]
MIEHGMLLEAKRRFVAELESRKGRGEDLFDEMVVSSPLSSKEALGDLIRDDFPLLRGREVLIQAAYRAAVGQAFTSAKGSFKGSLRDVLELPLTGNFERAVLISAMNAVLRDIGLVSGTVHCRGDGPKRCAVCMAEWIQEQGADRVGLVGMQPAILEALVETLGSDRVMVSDLAEAGRVCCGVVVLDGMESSEMFERCQLILMTGSTLANGTIDRLMVNARQHNNRVVIYGTTIAGAAYLLGLDRWCSCAT